MKLITFLLLVHLISSCAGGTGKIYTGSTPADAVIRTFLGLPGNDSVDFIRWKLIITENSYQLQCNYGIGKPNTNGFLNGGKKIECSGSLKKENIYYVLQNSNRSLHIAALNEDLLHIMDTSNHLLVGNGGWSYTLNNVMPKISDQVSITAKVTVLKDSTVFEGRTPCKVPGIIAPGSFCYKLKWYLILYANPATHQSAGYKVYGTAYRNEGGRTGNWKLIKDQNGRIIYQLNDDKGNGFIYLRKLDENILVFTTVEGKLLTGDEDFSYTLNRKQQ
jgi:hypothetical protein